MQEQHKPIRTERIDNPDGTYTIKEIYDIPKFDSCLSDIETFDAHDKLIIGTYYEDKRFKKLLFTETREYLDNGNYYRIQQYEQMQPEDYIALKALCDSNDKELEIWFYKDKDCSILSIYENWENLEDNTIKLRSYNYSYDEYSDKFFNDKKQTIYAIDYASKDFKTISSKFDYTYDKDGNYTVKMSAFYENSDEELCRTCISYFNNTDQLLKAESFYNEDFTNFYALDVYSYNKDGSYQVKTHSAKPDENGWLSKIEKYNNQAYFYYGEYYEDDNFSKLGLVHKRKFAKNGEYTDKLSYTDKKYKGFLSAIEKYDKEGNYTFGKYFEQPNYKKLSYTQQRKHNKDGSYYDYFRHCTQRDKTLSEIQFYNSKYICYCHKWFTDKNFKHQYAINNIDTNNGITIHKVKYEGMTLGIKYKSYITEEQKDITLTKYYKDDNFKDLVLTEHRYTNADGNNECKAVCETNTNGFLSTLWVKEKNTGKDIYQEWFEDKEFKESYCKKNYEYNEDGLYITKATYATLSENCYNAIAYYNAQEKIYKKEYFKDSELKELYATEKYVYENDNYYQQHTVFTEPYKEYLSCIEYNKNDKAFYAISYFDNEYKNIYRRTWIKYKDPYKLFLRIYEQSKDGYLSEIEKYDNDKNLIYKKQFKFKGVLAKILFFFAG